MSGETPGAERVQAVRSAFTNALRGDFEAVKGLLAEDVRWHAAGDEGGGCQNRRQALAWMRQAVASGASAELLEVRRLDEDRVLVLLRRMPDGDGDPPAHGQIVRFRGDQVSEIVVYASDEDAVKAAAAS